MKLVIELPLYKCTHIPTCSNYNRNIYQLPFIINYCEYVLKENDDEKNFLYFALGSLDEDNKFTIDYYLNTDKVNECIIINSEKISTENSFT